MGTLRRTSPLSNVWGYDRGTPIDRHYIDLFLTRNSSDIRGRVLEVKDDRYTTRFGSRIERQDILDIEPLNPNVTLLADLATAHAISPDQFDCFILTQTLQYVFDLEAAVRHAHRILRHQGVLLATLPGTARIDPSHRDYWRVTRASCETLFGRVFGADNVRVHSYGNILTSIGALMGMASQEFAKAELDLHDEEFQTLLAVRAVKDSV